MRKVLGLAGLIVLPLALGACSALGLDTSAVPNTGTSTGPGPVSNAGWVVVATGSATPEPSPSHPTGTPSPALPPVSFLPIDPQCAKSWTVDPPLIPMRITPGKGSLTVTWPRQYDSGYRITAVPQPLVSGSQPAYTWQNVPAGAGCTVTTTITGLTSGTPYVVWLDAPNTGFERDGARHPYSGESGVVYPT
ncbi:MAG TPA: hypothetical protein VFR35_06405 [Actinoplanes sp.]|nr:hypothetical protein [Actinoplanes sp.]